MNGWIMHQKSYDPGAPNVTELLDGSGVPAAVSSTAEFQNPLPCSAGVSVAIAGGCSLGYTARGSNTGDWKLAAICPRYEFGSDSGLPGPVVAVWTSNEPGGMRKVSVV